MSEADFRASLFAVVEHLTRAELTNAGKKLILYYLDELMEGSRSERARLVVRRYTQEEVPTLAAIRGKAAAEGLNNLDHLVLRMEYEAAKLDHPGSYTRRSGSA